MLAREQLQQWIEAVLFAAGKPMTEKQILALFEDSERPSAGDFRTAVYELQKDCMNRGIELLEIASGYYFSVKQDFNRWIVKLWDEKPPRYSRALLETLALIAYRQPITRGEIEEIRGVTTSTSIFKTLQEERNWVRVVGHREVPGRPGLYATTKEFLDYFGLRSLESLPPLPEILAMVEEGTEQKQQTDGEQGELELSDNIDIEEEEAELVE